MRFAKIPAIISAVTDLGLRLPDVLEHQELSLNLLSKTCYVLDSCKRSGCPWISSGVLENCRITPEQWSWVLCSVSATPVNKVLLQGMVLFNHAFLW